MTKQSRIEYLPLSSIQPALRNPKEHDLGGIATAIRRYGFVAPLILNEATGRIVAGHGRLEALKMLAMEPDAKPPRFVQASPKGEWAIPVLRGNSFASDEEAEAFLVAHNRWVEVGGWDPALLVPMLHELVKLEDKTALEAIGWSKADMLEYIGDFDETTRSRGETPEEKNERYNSGAIQQIVVYFPAEEVEGIQYRLEKVAVKEKVNTNSEILVKLLDRFEAAQ